MSRCMFHWMTDARQRLRGGCLLSLFVGLARRHPCFALDAKSETLPRPSTSARLPPRDIPWPAAVHKNMGGMMGMSLDACLQEPSLVSKHEWVGVDSAMSVSLPTPACRVCLLQHSESLTAYLQASVST